MCPAFERVFKIISFLYERTLKHIKKQLHLTITKMKKIIAFGLIGFCIASCQQKPKSPTDVFTVNMDTSILPANDFFDYANGGWVKSTPIPADESSWGIGSMVDEENDLRLKNINEEAASKMADSIQQKIGNFWKAAMDSHRIEKQGLKYIQPYLDSINSIQDLSQFAGMVGRLYAMGVPVLLNIGISQDDKQSSKYALRMSQGGLGLPDRDYYFNKDSATSNVRIAYVRHIINVLKLLGHDTAKLKKEAYSIFTLETRLAMYSRQLADLRDPYANYNKMTLDDVQKLSGKVQWRSLLWFAGIPAVDSVIVGQPEFLKSLNESLPSTSIQTLKNYLIYHLVNKYSDQLPEKFGKELFAYERWLSGAKSRKSRWKRVLSSEQHAMGELLGQLYVKKYFDVASKKRYEVMADEISQAYKERIQKLTWMTEPTKQKAIAKLAAIRRKIGYPDKWKDFSTMHISDESYLQNMINASRWWTGFDIARLSKPVDRDEWFMFPQTYNAYYNPSNNEIVFPAAAFIVPGYKDHELDDAVMYGYAGASYIGHEITHGFDDQGRLYDADGNLHNWWTKADSMAFAQRAAMIVKQFDGYEPLPGYHINGSATQGENIADLGGIEIGKDAFKKSKAFKENKVINGFTPMQRFFMGYALSWLYKMRPELLRMRLMTDVHSPAKFRVNGPFSDVDEFYKIYDVKKGNGMYIPDSLRVRIW